MSTYPDTWHAPAGMERPPVATEPAPTFAFAQAQRIRILQLKKRGAQASSGLGLQTAAQIWPGAQKKITDLALRGKLTDSMRKEAEWLGFELPPAEARYPSKIKEFGPLPKAVASAEDLAQLIEGAYGPATPDEVFELPPNSPLRLANDNPALDNPVKAAYVYAGGHAWRVEGHAFSKDVSLSARTAANAARRVEAEKKRANLKNIENTVAPLTAQFYGVAPVVKPRYTSPEEANAHEMLRRKNWISDMRKGHAQRVWEIRHVVERQDAATIAHWFTEWQRRRHGKGLVYLLSFVHEKEKELIATKAQP